MPRAVQQKPSRQQAVPQANDRILLLTEHWLRQILSGEKIAEVRRGRTSSGGAWLGCGGLIYAWVEFGEVQHLPDLLAIRSMEFAHGVVARDLPYGGQT